MRGSARLRWVSFPVLSALWLSLIATAVSSVADEAVVAAAGGSVLASAGGGLGSLQGGAGSYAYATLLYSDEYLLGARTLGQSIEATGTQYDRVALLAPNGAHGGGGQRESAWAGVGGLRPRPPPRAAEQIRGRRTRGEGAVGVQRGCGAERAPRVDGAICAASAGGSSACEDPSRPPFHLRQTAFLRTRSSVPMPPPLLGAPMFR